MTTTQSNSTGAIPRIEDMPALTLRSLLVVAAMLIASFIAIAATMMDAATNASTASLSLLWLAGGVVGVSVVVTTVVVVNGEERRGIAYAKKLDQVELADLVTASRSPEIGSESRSHIVAYLNDRYAGWSFAKG